MHPRRSVRQQVLVTLMPCEGTGGGPKGCRLPSPHPVALTPHRGAAPPARTPSPSRPRRPRACSRAARARGRRGAAAVCSAGRAGGAGARTELRRERCGRARSEAPSLRPQHPGGTPRPQRPPPHRRPLPAPSVSASGGRGPGGGAGGMRDGARRGGEGAGLRDGGAAGIALAVLRAEGARCGGCGGTRAVGALKCVPRERSARSVPSEKETDNKKAHTEGVRGAEQPARSPRRRGGGSAPDPRDRGARTIRQRILFLSFRLLLSTLGCRGRRWVGTAVLRGPGHFPPEGVRRRRRRARKEEARGERLSSSSAHNKGARAEARRERLRRAVRGVRGAQPDAGLCGASAGGGGAGPGAALGSGRGARAGRCAAAETGSCARAGARCGAGSPVATIRSPPPPRKRCFPSRRSLQGCRVPSVRGSPQPSPPLSAGGVPSPPQPPPCGMYPPPPPHLGRSVSLPPSSCSPLLSPILSSALCPPPPWGWVFLREGSAILCNCSPPQRSPVEALRSRDGARCLSRAGRTSPSPGTGRYTRYRWVYRYRRVAEHCCPQRRASHLSKKGRFANVPFSSRLQRDYSQAN